MIQLSFFLVLILPFVACQVTEFVSIDCGGRSNYTDPNTGLKWISDAGLVRHGKVVEVASPNGLQYQSRRDFPADGKKYCYTLSTIERRRYLVRATFQYAKSDSGDSFPKFQLYLDATMWSTITIQDSARIYIEEMIIRAPSSSVNVCLCCALTGSPFISSLELRPLNLSMYATDYEDDFFLKVGARINFGASSKDVVRYPDDPYDRIWSSDQEKRQNYLVGVAPGTESISTSQNIDTRAREYPPLKVMQTAAVGTKGWLSYRLDLEGFPANARAYAYLAEIEDLGNNETRKFTMQHPHVPGSGNVIINIAENANGSYTLYEPSYMNISLDFVFSFSLVKTWDSTRGPLLNAIEISKYVQTIPKTDSKDTTALKALRSKSQPSNWTSEEGDPCKPISWEWVACSSKMPPRITKISSFKCLNFISSEHIVERGCNVNQGSGDKTTLTAERYCILWLDGNSLTGPIPDLSSLTGLTILHLENNKLTGPLPSYLSNLPSLQELYVQNNSLSGAIDQELLARKMIFDYDGNPDLKPIRQRKTNFQLTIGISIGACVLLGLFLLASLLLLNILQRKQSHLNNNKKCSGIFSDDDLEGSFHITLSELEEATENFSKKIGKGSFGPVYYGKMKDGQEVAVKILADASNHGAHQFVNEVALLSRIHHKNLVHLIGCCEEAHQRILVYEYMHNGTLCDFIHGSLNQEHLDWISRLSIAEDAAKGLEYLHSGCNPSIIHRDVKTSNILLDVNMRAKVSDFGLSKQTDENLTHVSSVACGTLGYLDPEYYGNQQLTEKSDVYSFGVVLLELISGRKPFSLEEYGAEWSIVHWARSLIRKGDVTSVADPSLAGNFKIESLWRIAEVAILSIEPHGVSRPKMQEIVLAIQDAIKIEKSSFRRSTKSSATNPHMKSISIDLESSDVSNGCIIPSAR
ncbi:hypothetical protein Syun_024370 [Stephania yunnanensis]|uniref:non-specific serine/threonine protein kinase n=1 Tax=Stephania yunnanensis TaxID=152371 RepID=A0AAP0I4A6_9MAGN